ncbi:hypothetical protein [Variovorax ginsengisoli]|uniref:Uncharacterized protein n=1 Tax=Variovorax ginsengisoli TaxID=363844 RepID=A0ABT9SD42_9BURK|nr:hypothetical protein [Variovorax ginsengisoli]MDP9902259.1 hypothetical protein [Variovorax ginsengisoli]
MAPLTFASTSQRARGIGCALLWGAFEFVALARRRWTLRHHSRR